MAEYLDEYLGYKMRNNFISIEGLLQLAQIHIGCIVRAAAVDDAETIEMVQLICARQTMHSMCADGMSVSAALRRLAETSAISTNMLAHVLMVFVQIFAPNQEAGNMSGFVRQQIELLQCQMKIDPNTLLFEESRSEDGFYSELSKRFQRNDLLKYAPKMIAIEIMRGRKSNREQVFLGSGSDEYCDYMYMINKIVSQADRTYNWEQKAAMRAQILAHPWSLL